MVHSSRSHEQKTDNNHVPFHVLSYNCGRLSTIKDELFTWISDANLHAVFLKKKHGCWGSLTMRAGADSA